MIDLPRRPRAAVSRTRAPAFVLVLGMVVGACGGGSGTVPPEAVPAAVDVEAQSCAADPLSSTDRNIEGSSLAWIFGTELPSGFPQPTLTRTQIVPVLEADAIPAIDAPRCLPVGGVGFLEDDAPVVLLELEGEVRAYPLEILTWHELVNDTVAGVPVTVSYCPLCNSAIAYDRRLDGRVLDFGTSGALTQSSMVMYDRQTETLWTHLDGRAVAGELTGARLSFFTTAVVSWADVRASFPDALVLSRDTGFSRDYGRNPYPGYETEREPIDRFITDEVDPRLPAKVRVVGVEQNGEAVAVLHARLFELGTVAFRLGGRELAAFNVPGTASAVEGVLVSGGDDVGASAVFVPEVDGQRLSFSRVGDRFVDDQTSSTWTILGQAVAGPLAGARLERVPALDTFWFAWSTFHPATTIVL